MNFRNFIIHFQSSCFLLLITLPLSSMGGGQNYNTLLEPAFAPLEEGAGLFSGIVHDEKTASQITELSFFGHASVGGIRKETDDSVNRLELSKTKEIKIVNPSYISKRYSDKDFVLVDATTTNNTQIQRLLIPKHVVVCGREKDTKMERAWFLGRINKIVVDHAGKSTQKENLQEKTTIKQEKRYILKKDTKPVVLKKITDDDKKSKTVWTAFIAIIDSIIDFIKIALHSLFKFLGA